MIIVEDERDWLGCWWWKGWIGLLFMTKNGLRRKVWRFCDGLRERLFLIKRILNWINKTEKELNNSKAKVHFYPPNFKKLAILAP